VWKLTERITDYSLFGLWVVSAWFSWFALTALYWTCVVHISCVQRMVISLFESELIKHHFPNFPTSIRRHFIARWATLCWKKHSENVKLRLIRHWLELANQRFEVTRQFLWLDSKKFQITLTRRACAVAVPSLRGAYPPKQSSKSSKLKYETL